MLAHVPEAQVGLGRLVQEKSAGGGQPADKSRTAEFVETRLVGVQAGCGHWACQAAARADHLQVSDGRGRVRRRGRSDGRCDSVREQKARRGGGWLQVCMRPLALPIQQTNYKYYWL